MIIYLLTVTLGCTEPQEENQQKTDGTGGVGTTSKPTTGVYLYDGTDTVWLGTTKNNMSELVHAVTIKNQEAVNYLFSSGKAFSVPAYTKVIILDESLTLTKVRILEGKYMGEVGWTCYEWVKK